MSRRLCDLPDAPAETCCGTPPAPLAAPLPIDNPPGLSSIDYRIGTFATFRRAMLERIADSDLYAPDAIPNPFATWSEGSPGDYQTMFVELWAYLADVLTFYQERIANEAFLPTATQLSSLMRLAEAIGYEPQPGTSASAVVAFIVEKGKSARIAAPFRVSTKAAGGKPAAVFETSKSIDAIGTSSKMPVALIAPRNQFAKLAAFDAILLADAVGRVQAFFDVFGVLGGAFFEAFELGPSSASSSATVLPAGALAQRTVVLAGTKNRINPGDWLLAVANEGDATKESAEVVRVVSAAPDDESKTTTVVWEESEGRAQNGYDQSVKPVTVYAFRVEATPFGSNAANDTLASPPVNKPWNNPSRDEFFVPALDEKPRLLSLDSVYDAIDATPSSMGWVLVHKDSPAFPEALRITEAKTVGRAQYELSGKVTRIRLANDVPAKTYPLRGTTIHAANEAIPVQVKLPLPAKIGTSIILDGAFPELRSGQLVLFEGNVWKNGAATSERAAEQATIADPPVIDAANAITTIRLKPPLQRQYATAGAVVYANVVEATHGETVKTEILGSGDGSEFQTFELKKSPLTYLPSTSAEGLSAVESTLTVTVNNVRWNERDTLLESSPGAREYTTRNDDQAVTTVSFGDGVNGARIPTGKDNVRAQYRKGSGTGGNVASGAIQVLIDNIAGVQKVMNPIASTGGADAENVAQIRGNAPDSIRTFSRAVSVTDYAALALTYPGVAKASASLITIDPAAHVALEQPYIRLTIATADGVKLSEQRAFAAALRAYLDVRRDPNVQLRIVDLTEIYVNLTAEVDVLDDFPRENTRAAVEAAALDYFDFDRLGFGQSLRLSSVYAALQAVPGVRSVTITDFRNVTAPSGTLPGDVLVAATELAMMKNDPTDTAGAFGKLSVAAEGGFVEQ
ncbi:MAG TPA: putative baseplate assembly protein [Thermoanaerobaculia bacterium]|nr:putative baseplate assembly protein [Thermoanaerobaculia bacterium]